MDSSQIRASPVREAYAYLVRASSLARRPGVVVLDQDLSALSPLAGSRTKSHSLIAALEREGYLRPVRRDAYVLVDAAGGVRTSLLDLIPRSLWRCSPTRPCAAPSTPRRSAGSSRSQPSEPTAPSLLPHPGRGKGAALKSRPGDPARSTRPRPAAGRGRDGPACLRADRPEPRRCPARHRREPEMRGQGPQGTPHAVDPHDRASPRRLADRASR